MPKKVRTAKGVVIDFDLLKIKQKLVEGPKPQSVQARQDFIDSKLRRRMKKVKSDLDAAKQNPKPVEQKKPVAVELDEAKQITTPKRKIRKS